MLAATLQAINLKIFYQTMNEKDECDELLSYIWYWLNCWCVNTTNLKKSMLTVLQEVPSKSEAILAFPIISP